MIDVKNLCADYQGTTVLRDVSLTFEQGKVPSLLGPNGCGKSTLLRTILGLHPPKSRQILFNGVCSNQLTARQIAQKVPSLGAY